MCSMLMLGGSGGMNPKNFLKNRCSEIESDGILESIYLAIQYVLRSYVTCKTNVKLRVICISNYI